MTAPLREDLGADAIPRGVDAESAVRPELSDLERLRGRGRWQTLLAMLGPAFVACIAYIDPGNFATITRGSVYAPGPGTMFTASKGPRRGAFDKSAEMTRYYYVSVRGER